MGDVGLYCGKLTSQPHDIAVMLSIQVVLTTEREEPNLPIVSLRFMISSGASPLDIRYLQQEHANSGSAWSALHCRDGLRRCDSRPVLCSSQK
jgi:hypothetical protein